MKEYTLEPISKDFRNQLIDHIAEADRSILSYILRVRFLRNQSNKSMVNNLRKLTSIEGFKSSNCH